MSAVKKDIQDVQNVQDINSEPLNTRVQILLSTSEFQKLLKYSKKINRTISYVGRMFIIEKLNNIKLSNNNIKEGDL